MWRIAAVAVFIFISASMSIAQDSEECIGLCAEWQAEAVRWEEAAFHAVERWGEVEREYQCLYVYTNASLLTQFAHGDEVGDRFLRGLGDWLEMDVGDYLSQGEREDIFLAAYDFLKSNCESWL